MAPTQKTAYQMVTEFHERFGHPVSDYPTTVDSQTSRLRLGLILEEVAELIEASCAECTVPDSVLNNVAGLIRQSIGLINAAENREFNPDLVAVADALTDILYVTNGMGVVHGLDLDACMTEVHRANMSKLGADGLPVYNEQTGKVLKGENYSPPNLESILFP